MTRRIDKAAATAAPPKPARAPEKKPRRSGTPRKPAPAELETLARAYELADQHSQTFSTHAATSFALANGGPHVPAAALDVIGQLPTTVHEGSFEKKARVAGGEGSFGDENSLAQGEGHWDALYAYAGGTGEASLGANGLRAAGELHAGAGLVDLEGQARIGYGPIEAEVGGRAFVGAKANLYGDLTVDPAKGIYNAEVGGQAFAGAKAGVSGSVDLGPVGHVAGTAEVWAGAGAQFKAQLGIKDGRFRFKLDVGAALGIGFKLGGEFSINVQPVLDLVKGIGSFFKSAFKSSSELIVGGLKSTAQLGLVPWPMLEVAKSVKKVFDSII